MYTSFSTVQKQLYTKSFQKFKIDFFSHLQPNPKSTHRISLSICCSSLLCRPCSLLMVFTVWSKSATMISFSFTTCCLSVFVTFRDSTSLLLQCSWKSMRWRVLLFKSSNIIWYVLAWKVKKELLHSNPNILYVLLLI